MTGIQTALVLATMMNARHAGLRQYARWEYGAGDADWILGEAAREGRRATGPRRRIRHWIRTIRGLPAFGRRADPAGEGA